MKATRSTGHRLLVATVAAAVASLVAGPVASAGGKARPGKPKAGAVKRTLSTAARAQAGLAEIVSLGFDSRAGFEVYVVRIEGTGVVGVPFG